MSGSIVKLNASAHQETQELLPWFVLGTLNEEETALVQEHLGNCPHCQADLALQRKLQGMELPMRAEVDVERALAKMRPQLQAQVRGKQQPGIVERIAAWREAAGRLWMPWVMVAQTAALACLCVVVWHGQPTVNEYHVLGAKAGASGNLVVMFKPQTSEQEMRRILRAGDARLVDGPTVTGAYVLSVSEGTRVQALDALHHEPAVVMAESLEGDEKTGVSH
jgi:hypothetical protein